LLRLAENTFRDHGRKSPFMIRSNTKIHRNKKKSHCTLLSRTLYVSKEGVVSEVSVYL
jgi:hypothetical protein